MKEELKIIESLQKDFGKYAPDKPDQPVLVTVSQNGHHLIDIGAHVEAWLLDKYCLMFEDGEMIAGFAHHDEKDYKLIERCCNVYHIMLPAMKVKH